MFVIFLLLTIVLIITIAILHHLDTRPETGQTWRITDGSSNISVETRKILYITRKEVIWEDEPNFIFRRSRYRFLYKIK